MEEPKEDSYELHVPGYNFMGPGTHIYERIKNGTQPTNYTDRLALAHDVNYYLASGSHDKLNQADDLAIAKARWYQRDGVIMKIGLTLRKLTHVKENGEDTKKLGLYLKNILLTDDRYKKWEFTEEDFI